MDKGERESFGETLKLISQKPLEYHPEFPAAAERWESWWRMENQHPLMPASMPKEGCLDTRGCKYLDLMDEPIAWLDAREKQLAEVTNSKDWIPSVRPDIGPVVPAAFLGATLELKPQQETAWQHPIIDDWEDLPDISIDPDNRWYGLVLELMSLIAERGQGKYVVCSPDTSGPADILANLRGSENLCMDLYDEREAIMEIQPILTQAVGHYMDSFYDATVGKGMGLIQWTGAWSDVPYVSPTCDFSALISPRDFEEVFMPFYEQQAEYTGRTLFHLDGPDAARQKDVLIRSGMDAIQFQPGAGTPSLIPHIPMLRAFQEAGKPILLETLHEEVDELLNSLSHQGLAIRVWDCKEENDIKRLDALAGW